MECDGQVERVMIGGASQGSGAGCEQYAGRCAQKGSAGRHGVLGLRSGTGHEYSPMTPPCRAPPITMP